MQSTKNGWTIVDGDAGILSREYHFSKESTARCMVARAGDGHLIIISPPNDVDDRALKDLEEFGTVTALVANNGFHHLGLPVFQKAFPQAQAFAPEAALPRIRKKHPGLTNIQPLEVLPERWRKGVKVLAVPGFRMGEAWVTVETANGPVWYVGDSCFSLEQLPKNVLARTLFKWTGTAPGFRLNRIGQMAFLKDKPAYKKWMLDHLHASLPTTIVTAHGKIMTEPQIGKTFQDLVETGL